MAIQWHENLAAMHAAAEGKLRLRYFEAPG
jgi:hypothetical protein